MKFGLHIKNEQICKPMLKILKCQSIDMFQYGVTLQRVKTWL